MVTRLIEANEIKIFILYIMHSLNKPMKYEDITAVIVQDGIVAGLDFADCFADLIENENIKEFRDGDDRYYEISARGRLIAESLQEDVPVWVRRQGLKSALRLMSYKERGSEISTSYERRADGKFDLCCRIVDERQLSLEIKIVADSVKQLELMMHNFDDRPEIMYRGVMALLCGDMEYILSD